MPDDDLLLRLRRFQDDAFPLQAARSRAQVDEGQHPATLSIGCSDSRLVPYLPTGAGTYLPASERPRDTPGEPW